MPGSSLGVPYKPNRFEYGEEYPSMKSRVLEGDEKKNIYRYSAIEDTRVSHFTHNQLMLV